MVLTSPTAFAIPFDVSRKRVRRTGVPSAKPQKPTPILGNSAVRIGHSVFQAEFATAASGLSGEIDALVLLREPVARSTSAALMPDADVQTRERVAALVLAWIDALAPVISARRPPRSWTKVRRTEQRVYAALVRELTSAGCVDPSAMATALAAGTQVPIAAGAWCLTLMASRPDLHGAIREDRSLVMCFVWEVLRLVPPTWVLPRVSTRAVTIGATTVPPYTPVLVSPVALGRLAHLVPGPEQGAGELADLDPRRWVSSVQRPGAWLPFGAGPHACPGKNLGLAQLASTVAWAAQTNLDPAGPVSVDSSRGLSPSPSTIRIRKHEDA